ncbi:hypothetical protein BBP00_00001584 [Phytophthora kernoviae]|uniref:NADPH:adrenodoxin oxidoreductase, mitochondrial n=1 Tax=Phytophthora kernoviae TaxID=325452 RepID=A0A3F2S1B4_9STRA|nr:hypothetical protein BBP00_00001584 [Phytophthora kernoviae]
MLHRSLASPLRARTQRLLCPKVARSFSTAPDAPKLRVCVVGSGPGGFYATKYLLKEHTGVRVDMLEALPTPFGLVRSGVAPDHPEVKSVMNDFAKVAADERFRFLGNVRVGEDVRLADLQQHYHAVVLAYGAAGDRELGVPGEDLRGVMSARTFVNWYNGHPAFRDLDLDLQDVETAVVIGQGNVAVDCARILTKNVDELASTDIATHSVKVLRRSGVKKVLLVGRRGKDMKRSKTPSSELEIKEQRARKRMNDLLSKAAEQFDTTSDAERVVQIKFLSSPAEILADEKDATRVGAIRIEKTSLEGEPNQQRAVGTGEFEDIPCSLVLRSIGYKSLPIEADAPFDQRRHVVSNEQGRVVATSESGETEPVVGLYCTGWAKRGPSGIIGTNIVDARETVSCIVEDFASGKFLHTNEENLAGLEAVEKLIKKRNPDKQLVRWTDYERLNSEENRRGELVGKPREKITSVAEMLAVAKSVK